MSRGLSATAELLICLVGQYASGNSSSSRNTSVTSRWRSVQSFVQTYCEHKP